jgi:hypothetical protein
MQEFEMFLSTHIINLEEISNPFTNNVNKISYGPGCEHEFPAGLALSTT